MSRFLEAFRAAYSPYKTAAQIAKEIGASPATICALRRQVGLSPTAVNWHTVFKELGRAADDIKTLQDTAERLGFPRPTRGVTLLAIRRWGGRSKKLKKCPPPAKTRQAETEKVEVPEPPPDCKTAPKGRNCLCCRNQFLSAWAGERICRTCKASSTWRQGIPLEGVAASSLSGLIS